MKTLYKTLSILSLIFLIHGCSKNNEDSIPNPPELQAYLDRFLQEAEQLGKSYDVSKLDLRFVDEQVQGMYCGYGYTNYNNSGRQRIEIFNSEGCWSGRDDLEKETLFFHEIGHALLGRPHTEEQLPNSLPKSLMCSQCNIFGIYDEYHLHRREYYLKDLILLNPLIPDWGLIKNNFVSFYEDAFATADTWSFLSHDAAITSDFSTGDSNYPEGGLLIGSKDQFSNNFAYWVKAFSNPQIPQGATIKLEVKFKLIETLQGNGLSVVLRFDDIDGVDSKQIAFYSTQGETHIGGQLNQTIELKALDYQIATDNVRLFIVYLGETKGEAMIESVKLSYAED